MFSSRAQGLHDEGAVQLVASAKRFQLLGVEKFFPKIMENHNHSEQTILGYVYKCRTQWKDKLQKNSVAC